MLVLCPLIPPLSEFCSGVMSDFHASAEHTFRDDEVERELVTVTSLANLTDVLSRTVWINK
jgi:hypothetical protein